MPQQERTPEGERRWRETRERAEVRAKKFFDRVVGNLETGTLLLDEEELIKMLTGFALDERKLETERIKALHMGLGEPSPTAGDLDFARIAAKEMGEVAEGRRSNDLWLHCVARGIARARRHWEDTAAAAERERHPVMQVKPEDGRPPDQVAQEFKAQETKPAGCYEKGRATGEPMFTLLARDVSAPWVVFEWVRRNWHHCRPEKLADALRIAQEMERWPNKKAAD